MEITASALDTLQQLVQLFGALLAVIVNFLGGGPLPMFLGNAGGPFQGGGGGGGAGGGSSGSGGKGKGTKK